ncbi:S-methyl-5-thioribose-1-phosphate isomerase [Nocardia sp. NEAU-G5]|uniref:Methylthioribose-1-phosphate isomerase n=1 Tax=Nocardia albiluteola TaxID=2842303 RepID=A0ABS6B692_9NOCA|nr:S-methyl-5-thioribose-1-phosphate isomerase [Nocardia albiluteola]MBU3064664.1 S-methyl-5-thioribose-1-phosphate isomerase [Nocardia albiluteola]
MGESSIAWVDGALVIIDQRALPREVRSLRITTVDGVIEAIATLAVRGAPAIGVAGAFGVVLAALAHAGDEARVLAEAERIASARPTAVNLAWGVRRALRRLPDGATAMLEEAMAMLDEDGQVNRAAAAHAADLVQRVCPDRPLRMLTHCNTGRLATAAFGTALGAIRVLAQRGAIESVLVDETRPLLQGARLTAWELVEAGIPHRLTIDSAAAWAMRTGQVDCVVVGADRITADGSVANKIGTYALALAAHHHGIPFVVVAPESTRDLATATGDEIVVEERAEKEITEVAGVATAPAGTAVFNPAFDVTPPELVTAVVTENGVVSGTVIGRDPAAERDHVASQSRAGSVVRGGVEDAGAETELVAAQSIANLARGLYGRGWMPGTAGNISVRAGKAAVVTGSGLSKGELGASDMVTVNIADSQQISGLRRPSAETAIHTAIYRATGAEAVVHVHPPYATVQSITAPAEAGTTDSGGAVARPADAPATLRFTGYELIKGLGAAEIIDIPVFANHPDVSRIGADIERYLIEHPAAPPVLFIAGHGITAWGAGLAQARDRAECLEAMCELVSLSGRRNIGADPGV